MLNNKRFKSDVNYQQFVMKEGAWRMGGTIYAVLTDNKDNTIQWIVWSQKMASCLQVCNIEETRKQEASSIKGLFNDELGQARGH